MVPPSELPLTSLATSQLANTVSSWKVVRSGVPLGSIVGPLLFTLFSYDLANAINESSLLSFADDTNLHASNECPRAVENVINQDLFTGSSWFKQYGTIGVSLKYGPQTLKGNVWQK